MVLEQHSGLIVHALTRRFDCSNNGVTTKYNQFLLIDPQDPDFGTHNVADMDPSTILIVARGKSCGYEYIYARPVNDETGEVIQAKQGGNFIYCPGTAYRKKIGPYPIAVFDRL